ncbi:hypothetical protein BLA24_18470 [Streptomyces cinnamoneus]|uniref:Uncharacterized protein n=1 Tax=Streptomyces cinnamoneus TaxID=53446 RepID=A0A2G1XHU5_STRCJ|nr:hypothetical protein [Streptomyces cinnamoneus]PHQ50761.1 hypothetical protein BLA24_18470 [Streptomyces cinnamoneus]PPT13981.1 hypothetical protein CYQ11_14810 [Streptomyces cinnamoneus]
MRRPVLAARTRIAVAHGAVFLVLGTGLPATVTVLSRAGTQEWRDGEGRPPGGKRPSRGGGTGAGTACGGAG